MAEGARLETMARRHLQRRPYPVGRQGARQVAAHGGDAEMRPEELVGGGQQHVGVETGPVYASVRRQVHAVDPHQCAGVVRRGRQASGIRDRAQRVRRERERDHARAPCDQCLHGIDAERAVARIQARRADGQAAVAGDEQPGRDVRVVVELGDDDLVARLERPRHRVREQEVDRGRVGAEHDLFLGAAQEIRRCQVSVVHELLAVDRGHERAAEVRVGAQEIVGHRAGHGIGRLRAPGPVEIDRRKAVHLPAQGGEARADRREVETLVHGRTASHKRGKARVPPA